ncbi:MAG TPA: type II and III secretion system protein family protein [Pseudolabrys sp.]|nr:type II and III secretion system protein family protein [Pseudolabrys sp.]
MSVPQYKSRTLKLDRPFASTAVGAPDIADVLPVSDRIIYIQGKKIGTTNITIFDRDKQVIAILDVDVTIDTARLAAEIQSSTGSKSIRVSSNNSQIILTGTAPNATVADQAVSIANATAKATTPNVPVVNAMSVAGSQQVMLKVRFLEASHDAERDLGVNWYAANSTGTRGLNTGVGGLTQAGRTITESTSSGGTTTRSTSGGLPLFQTIGTLVGTGTGQPFGVALANLVNSSGMSIDLLISALETKGLVRRLAEPDLVALSGDSASFLAGGEIPVPTQVSTATGIPQVTVDYKPFGVQLTFVPTVLANGVINLRLTPSVSELDFTKGVVQNGFLIPALNKREARTTIELRDGQSFAIAGLLQTQNIDNMSQVPWIGSVPVLGSLFRSTQYQQHQTDLVVIVTPHLVAPGAPGQPVASPLDQRIPGNDIDRFLLGQSEVRKKYSDYVSNGGGLQGPYGFIMPTDVKSGR